MKHSSNKPLPAVPLRNRRLPLTPAARSLLLEKARVIAEVFAEDADQIAIAAKYAERCEDPTRRVLALALREFEKDEYGVRPGAGSRDRQLFDAGALEMLNRVKPYLCGAIRNLNPLK